jgi:hypothetical protein
MRLTDEERGAVQRAVRFMDSAVENKKLTMAANSLLTDAEKLAGQNGCVALSRDVQILQRVLKRDRQAKSGFAKPGFGK